MKSISCALLFLLFPLNGVAVAQDQWAGQRVGIPGIPADPPYFPELKGIKTGEVITPEPACYDPSSGKQSPLGNAASCPTGTVTSVIEKSTKVTAVPEGAGGGKVRNSVSFLQDGTRIQIRLPASLTLMGLYRFPILRRLVR